MIITVVYIYIYIYILPTTMSLFVNMYTEEKQSQIDTRSMIQEHQYILNHCSATSYMNVLVPTTAISNSSY
jgi:hypothetical protein